MRLRFIRTLCGAALLALLPGAGLAADAVPSSPLDGTWRWNFTNADGGIIQPTLKVKTGDDGKLTGIARFRSGTSTNVTNLTLADEQVSFEVVRARNGETIVTHYRGTLQGDKITGRMVANWPGQEESRDWNAFRYGDLEGVWKWRLGGDTNAPGGRGGAPGGVRRGGPRGGAPGGGGEITLTIKREEGENISGKISLGAAEQEIHEPTFHESNLYFETSRTRTDGELSTNYYWGKFSKDTITGKFTTDAGGVHRTNDWRAARAE